MKKPLFLFLSISSFLAFGQTNNTNTGSFPPAPPTNTTTPQQNNPNQPVPAQQGTEPNNRVMLRSQIDSMDTKRRQVPVNRPLNGDTLGHNRNFKSDGDPIVNPSRKDSVH
ncbi:MAG: hypothetical protein ABI763_11745 [Bacteroidota bacterium]